MIEDREYQLECVNKASTGNWLVVLGTALGKTVIATKIIDKTFEVGKKVLFLAPTTVLCEQHLTNIPFMIGSGPKMSNMLTGDVPPGRRAELWRISDIIVATPQTIESDVKNGRYDLSQVSRIIFDEAHHGVGDYSYVYVAAAAPHAIITGFTASPGDNLEELKRLLRLEHVFYRSDESEDVKPYINEVGLQTIFVDLPKEYAEVNEFLEIGAWCCALKIGRSLFADFIETKKHEQRKVLKDEKAEIEYSNDEIKKFWKEFEKPFKKFSAPGRKEGIAVLSVAAQLKMWGVVTNASVLMNYLHARNLLLTQDIEVLYHYIDKLPDGEFTRNQKSFWLQCERIRQKMKDIKHIRHPKMYELVKQIEMEKIDNPDAKIMVFSHFRDSAVMISKRLQEFGVKSSHFIGKTSGKGTKGMSRKVQQDLLEQFKAGIDVLVATQVAEEGLDIAEVSLVIFYEPADNTIRYIQRKGRTGRKDEGRVVFLVAKGTSDVATYWSTMRKFKSEKKKLKEISG